MNELRQTTERDQVSLQMENELLTLEVRHLRARLKASERDSDNQARAAFGDLQRRFDALRAEHKRTMGDLRWLLRRLNESPLGPLLRRTGGFRTLVGRYLQQPSK